MNRSQFKKLVFLLFVLFIGDCFVELVVSASIIPETIRTPYEAYIKTYANSASFAFAAFQLGLYAFILLGTLIAFTGLFKLSRWGRTLYSVTIAAFPIYTIMTGGVAVASWAGILFAWGYFIAAGIALGVAWFSPLKDEFSADDPTATMSN